MPEGDTIFRSAATLQRWLGGRVITAARGRSLGLDALVGRTVESAAARGKHLLIRFTAAGPSTDRLVLRTHMLMTGSWHVYERDAPWKRPPRQATIVLEAGDRLAVGFNVPVVELTTEANAERGRSLAGLGPDLLVDPFDLDDVCRRAAASPPARPIGDLLLDQRVVAGIGNIYRCEALFARGVHPWTPTGQVELRALVLEASSLMRANIGPQSASRGFGPEATRPWVYGRTGRPCRRCGVLIEARRLGDQARTAYWCPSCQPAPAGWM